jgi:hypothetical protein
MEGVSVMKYTIVLTLAIAFCLPAYADVLVFQTSTSGQQLDVENKIVEKKSERGYLVINADLSNPNSVSVNEAYHLHYEKKAGNNIQYTTILDPGNMEIILVNYSRSKKMTLRWFDDPTGTYTAVFGTAALKDIGGFSRYISSSLSGNIVWREQDFRTGSGTIRVRLDISATKLANSTSQTAVSIIEGYSLALASKGYNAE